MFTHRIVIGDWSDDGHGKWDYFTFECSHDKPQIKAAYKKAIKKSKVSLHDSEKGAKAICTEYEQNKIPDDALARLKDLGVDLEVLEIEDGQCYAEGIAKLFFEMVKTQITGFTYKLIKEIETINGFWSKDFNYSFGYGCYD